MVFNRLDLGNKSPYSIETGLDRLGPLNRTAGYCPATYRCIPCLLLQYLENGVPASGSVPLLPRVLFSHPYD